MLATEGFSTYVWNNQIKSVLLLLGFPLLLALMLGAFFGIMGAVSGPQPGTLDWSHALHYGWQGMRDYGHWAVMAAGIWFVIAYFFHGKMMRMATGSQPITRQQMPKIYNMLENLCISRGIPMPKFEIIDSPALNAFATGISNDTYKIVLTRGIVERLQDDELEAVIAHELSHILNRDVRLLIIAVIFVGMISFFCQMIFRSLAYGGRPAYGYGYRQRRGHNRDNTAGIMFIALIVLAVGYLFAILIRFALSRRREYLADAGAVELTKNPEAMMRALMRISGNDEVKNMPSEVQQMCIENSHDFMGMFATHPKIGDRIAAISRTTGAPVPQLPVSLRRAPEEPWQDGRPPGSPWGKRY